MQTSIQVSAIRTDTPEGSILREVRKERARIAMDLHAGAGQPMAGIRLNLDMLGELLDGCGADLPAPAKDILARLRNLAEQAQDQLRAVSHGLYPLHWHALTTEAALRRLVESSAVDERFHVELNIGPLPFEPSQPVKIVIYRCVQECLSNIMRHSHASRVSVSLQVSRERLPFAVQALELCVKDNGTGFPMMACKQRGIGLLAIQEHAESVNGAAHISSARAGVTIRVRIPLSGEEGEQ